MIIDVSKKFIAARVDTYTIILLHNQKYLTYFQYIIDGLKHQPVLL